MFICIFILWLWKGSRGNARRRHWILNAIVYKAAWAPDLELPVTKKDKPRSKNAQKERKEKETMKMRGVRVLHERDMGTKPNKQLTVAKAASIFLDQNQESNQQYWIIVQSIK